MLAEEIVVRPFVRVSGVHGYDWIEEYLEVGHNISLGMGSESGRKVASGRESHYSHVVAVDIPFLGIHTHHAHSLLHIAHRHLLVAVRHAVLEHEDSYSHLVEEGCPVLSLMIHGKSSIATARANDDGSPRGLLAFWQKGIEFGRIRGYRTFNYRFACPQVYLEIALSIGGSNSTKAEGK